MRIILTEYPKSGGSWVVSMLGDALQLPKRDIYVSEGFKHFDIKQHPWYRGAQPLGLVESCVIKSHELPNSPLTTFPALLVHLYRDGRDVAVSKYFFEKEFCVNNGIYKEFKASFSEYLPKVAEEWRDYVFAWLNACPLNCKYEDFLKDPCRSLQNLLSGIGIHLPYQRICSAVESNTKNKCKKRFEKTFIYNTFVRKGIAGDWRSHFEKEHVRVFKKIAGDELVLLGYETDLNW